MANLTHSAFRRLLADFGGCGAAFSEMLSARMILHEDFAASPWLKRRPGEGPVVDQLLVNSPFRLDAVVARLAGEGRDALDLNCACGAPTVTVRGGGAALFDDPARMRAILAILRRGFAGPLSCKIRLGHERPGWREVLAERLRLMEEEGVDAVTLHLRFFEDKFKRRARHEWFPELAASTRLPVIVNGDITGPDFAAAHAAELAGAAGLMVGRQAAAQPWLFGRWREPARPVDLRETALRFCDYLAADFPPDTALRRLKVWIPYFACNFKYRHTLFSAIRHAAAWADAVERLRLFLDSEPERQADVTITLS